VLLSSIINQEIPDVAKDKLRKSYQAMISGGLLMILDQFLNTEKNKSVTVGARRYKTVDLYSSWRWRRAIQ